MSSVIEALDKGTLKYKEAYKRRAAKSNLGVASVTKAVTFFNHRFELLDYGSSPMVTEEVRNKLNGIIKMARKNGKDESWIFDVLGEVLERWDELSKKRITTLKGKRWHVGPRPSLRDFVFCHESLTATLNSFKKEDELVEKTFRLSDKVKSRPLVGRGAKVKPTVEDLEDAARDDYYG